MRICVACNAPAQHKCERLTVATVLRSLVCLHVCLGVILDERPHTLVGSVHLAKPSSLNQQHCEGLRCGIACKCTYLW